MATINKTPRNKANCISFRPSEEDWIKLERLALQLSDKLGTRIRMSNIIEMCITEGLPQIQTKHGLNT
jgi:hypothetical protein